MGLGAATGGVTATDADWHGAALNHHFNGTFIDILGVSGDGNAGVGTTLENLILRQTFGTGASAAGVAVRVFTTSNTYFPRGCG